MTFVLRPCGRFPLVLLALSQLLPVLPLFGPPLELEIDTQFVDLAQRQFQLGNLTWMVLFALATGWQIYRESFSHYFFPVRTHGYRLGAVYFLEEIEQL